MTRSPALMTAPVLLILALPGHAPRTALPGWASDAWRTGAVAALREQEYRPGWQDGAWQAPNRRQGLRARFRDTGVEVVPRDPAAGAWHWRWTWDGIGRPGGETPLVVPVAPRLQGSRIEYARDGLTEWYDNRPGGLEQGFRIDHRPAGSGPLRLSGRVESSLAADLGRPGAIVYRDDAGRIPIEYRDLHAEDATGRALDAWMEADASTIALVVDDRDAVYPVLIDPTLGLPLWTGDVDQAGAEYGSTVAAAGDVNDDGYDDILIGAPEYDNGLVGEGAVFLYYGGPDGPSDTPAWTVEGNQTGAALGRAICGGRDFNLDGNDDIVLGAAAYSSGGGLLLAGRVWIYAGSDDGPLAAPVFTRNGDGVSDGFGTSVAVGPVGGTAIPDLIVGAGNFDNGQSEEGRAYLFLNAASAPYWPDTTPDWTYEPNQANAHMGESVAFAGDVNGDGSGDVLVSAPDLDNGQADEGRVYVFHGTAGGSLAANAARLLEANLASSAFGSQVAGAGDVNGDGYGDILVGAPGFSNGEAGEGRAFLYLGSATGIPTTSAWGYEANRTTAAAGEAVSSAGDVNADGYADVIIGAPNLDNAVTDGGRFLLFPGGPAGLPASTTLNSDGAQTGTFLGCSVAGVGDVNGDGFGDVLLGARLFDNGETDEGVAYLYAGQGDPPNLPAWGIPDAGAITHSLDFGDVNGDGFSDLVIGTPTFTNGQSNEGKVEVYHGSRAGLPATPNFSQEISITGAALGTSVCIVGDMNGDGYADLVVGAPGSVGGNGQVRLHLGTASGIPASPNQTPSGTNVGSAFGTALAGGDVNGDGYADMAVTAPAYTSGQTAEGAVYLLLGAADGKFKNSTFVLCETNQANAGAGLSVAMADLNGDGLQEVIVGEPLWSNGQTEEGRVRIFLGRPSGPLTTPVWTRESNVASLHWGSWVAGVGDVNADGRGDWAVCGNAGSSNAETDLFHGRSSLTSTVPDWQITANGAGNRVAPLGDVDGDGIDDFLLANYNVGATTRGTLTVYRGTLDGPDNFWSTVGSVNLVNLGRAVPLHAGDVNADLFGDVAVTSYGLPDATIGTTEVTLWYGHGGRGLYSRPRLVTFPGGVPIAAQGLVPLGQSANCQYRLRSPGGRGYGSAGLTTVRVGGPGSGSTFLTSPLDAPVVGEGSFRDLTSGAGGAFGAAYRAFGWLQGNGPAWPRRKFALFASVSRTDLQYRFGLPVSDVPEAAPPAAALRLGPIHPNPLRGSGTIGFDLPAAGPVSLAVFDVSGRRVSLLLDDEPRPAGRADVRWDGGADDGSPLAAGVYFARLVHGGRSATTRIVLVR